jgi:hypothetical protein
MNRIIILIVSFMSIYNITLAQTPANDLNWQLKWQDHFNSFNNQMRIILTK